MADLVDLVAHYAAGRYAEAEAAARKQIEAWPEHGPLWKVLGTVLATQQRFGDALPALRKAVALSPTDAEAYNSLGFVQMALSQTAEAEGSIRRALELNPGLAAGHVNLGGIFQGLGRINEALGSYQRAVALNPQSAMAHNNLGAVLNDFDRFDEAIASFLRAAAINPGLVEAHANLGNTFSEMGKPEQAVASYRRAAALSAESGRRSYELAAALVLPVIAESRGHIASWRGRLAEEIAAMSRSLANRPGGPATLLLPRPAAFYLAYHDEGDRGLMESLHALMRAVYPELSFTSPHLGAWRGAAGGARRWRIGFASEFLAEHTIGKLFQGFIRELDRERFEVIVIHTPKARRDAARERIDSWADRAVALSGPLANMQRQVAAENLDALFYPDIGMSPTTYFLAFARLAPVQATSFGHPDTTGIDSMDYFVSARTMEPDDSQDHYSERLIRLSRIPSCYRPIVPAVVPGRAELGLPGAATLYGCPQSLFKFHPDFDAVLGAIAAGDPGGRIVLIESKREAALGKLLRERWARSAPILLERVLWLPALPHDRFMALNAHVDVLLDPVHFGGGNTMYEAMVYGTPIVAWPGRFMRGRITTAGLRQLEVADAPIAGSLDDYAALALALGRDASRRNALRQALAAAAKRKLYEDRGVVREFEDFLVAALIAAAQGKKLPAGWTPPTASQVN